MFGHYADECWHKKDGNKSSNSEVVLMMATTCEGNPLCDD